MQRLALFVLAVAAVVSAYEFGPYTVENVAKQMESDVPTVEGCMKDVGATAAEIETVETNWTNMKNGHMDAEIKPLFTKLCSFFACMLEKKDLMVDSKLVQDKVVALLEPYQGHPGVMTVDDLSACVTSLNNNNDLTRENRAFKIVVCLFPD